MGTISIMRAYLASSIGVACTAALALPLALYPGPAHARTERAATSGSTQSLPLLPLASGGLDRGVAAPGGDTGDRGVAAPDVRPFSLVGVVWDRPSAGLRARVQVRTRAVGSGEWSPWRELLPYEDEAPDPDSPERRSARAHGGTAPLWVGDSDGVQARVRAERTATADADGRAVADEGADGRAVAGGVRAAALPAGLRLELVDPGEAPAPPPGRGALRALPAHPVPPRPVPPHSVPTRPAPPQSVPTRPASPQSVPTRPARTHPVPTRPVPPRSAPTHPAPTPGGAGAAPGAKPSAGSSSRKSSGKPSAGLPSGLSSGKPSPDPSSPRPSPSKATAGPLPSPAPSTQPPSALGAEVTKANAAGHTAPRPRIITRAGWGADEKIREKGHVYSKTVKVAFIHHTVTGNKYSCSQAPSVLRSIYRYHVKSLGWRDYGYNFTIDKCGKIYEGRSGGVAKAVRGAHTLGFNTNSMGVAVLGTFSTKKPPAKAVKAIAKLTAWKLGLFKRNPRGTTHLVSGGGNKYKKGASVKLHVIAGHRDGFATECPGKRLYKKLGSVRKTAARLQGR
ncbi:hypothetical protein Shyhy02_78890 [Streptomyces hygroscopicus subsp. hygroscopicus]|nr:hypothetical protein Shyhy02_78890 [Streptomyces hygroscopicus subsp. hygroscopicus]